MLLSRVYVVVAVFHKLQQAVKATIIFSVTQPQDIFAQKSWFDTTDVAVTNVCCCCCFAGVAILAKIATIVTKPQNISQRKSWV